MRRNVIRNILQHFLRFDKRKQGSCCFRKTGLRVQGHGFYWRRSESGTKFPTGQFTIFRIPGIMCCARSTLMQEIFRCDSKEARAEKFCRYWVLKESFMKATRKGMALKMSSFEILLSNPPRLIKKPEEFEETYYYCEYPLEGFPYRIAVCSNDSELDSRIQMELKEIWQE